MGLGETEQPEQRADPGRSLRHQGFGRFFARGFGRIDRTARARALERGDELRNPRGLPEGVGPSSEQPLFAVRFQGSHAAPVRGFEALHFVNGNSNRRFPGCPDQARVREHEKALLEIAVRTDIEPRRREDTFPGFCNKIHTSDSVLMLKSAFLTMLSQVHSHAPTKPRFREGRPT